MYPWWGLTGGQTHEIIRMLLLICSISTDYIVQATNYQYRCQMQFMGILMSLIAR